MQRLVEFRDVTYTAAPSLQVLRGITLSVAQGETVVLLGRSGSGKTTLLKTVNRLIEPGGGEILFENKPIREWDPIPLRRRIGYVIQDGGLFPHESIERNVGLVPRLEQWPPERIRDRTRELLSLMGLPFEKYAARYPRQLSGGEKQRVGIARALAANPPLLLLDEPFAALDPITRYELQREFIALRERFQQTALFVTHDVREALAVGSRIALLDQGKLEFIGTPDQFVQAATPQARAFRATLEAIHPHA